MKQVVFQMLISCWPVVVCCQTFVNPDTIYQHGDIYIHNTNVYYRPFAAPGPTVKKVIKE